MGRSRRLFQAERHRRRLHRQLNRRATAAGWRQTIARVAAAAVLQALWVPPSQGAAAGHTALPVHQARFPAGTKRRQLADAVSRLQKLQHASLQGQRVAAAASDLDPQEQERVQSGGYPHVLVAAVRRRVGPEHVAMALAARAARRVGVSGVHHVADDLQGSQVRPARLVDRDVARSATDASAGHRHPKGFVVALQERSRVREEPVHTRVVSRDIRVLFLEEPAGRDPQALPAANR
mmetsp:Transcript_58398/g.126840  ORF Transcript_58398/g.126840 Transcript_58398/m.126840 type:complete len:236 (+) Transcript_58398:650-1357(+)